VGNFAKFRPEKYDFDLYFYGENGPDSPDFEIKIKNSRLPDFYEKFQ
jgi:hypothetical protein